MSRHEALDALLQSLEGARDRLAGSAEDPDAAAAALAEIGELAKRAQDELERARQAVRESRGDEG